MNHANKHKNKFTFSYSPVQNKEILEIRNKYLEVIENMEKERREETIFNENSMNKGIFANLLNKYIKRLSTF